MKQLSNILRKEVRELLTPATVLPILILALVFGSMGNVIGGAQEEATKLPTIGLINNDQGNYSALAAYVIEQNSKTIYNGTNLQEGLEKVSGAGGAALLMIDQNFSADIASNRPGTIRVYWIMSGAGVLDSISSGVVNNLLANASTTLSMVLISEHSSDDPAVVLAPIARNETTFYKGMTMDGISPGQISSVLSSQSFVVPLVVMMVVLMSGSTVIASMGMEKENKTLETLLTMPVKRSHIVVGKLGGAAAVGLLMAFIYMLGMGYYMNSMQAATTINLANYGLVLDLTDYAILGLSLFLAVVGGLAMCMVIGAFARDYKSAQALTMPVTFLAMIPMFALMMKDFNTLPTFAQAGIFLIPFSHPMMAMNNLMFGDYGLVFAGLAYEALFAGAFMAAAVWLFKKDILVTGRKKRTGGKSINPLWRGLGK